MDETGASTPPSALRLRLAHEQQGLTGSAESDGTWDGFDPLSFGIIDGFRPRSPPAERDQPSRPPPPLSHPSTRSRTSRTIDSPRVPSPEISSSVPVDPSPPAAQLNSLAPTKTSAEQNNNDEPRNPALLLETTASSDRSAPTKAEFPQTPGLGFTGTSGSLAGPANGGQVEPENAVRGPRHPYALYPQNTVIEENTSLPASAIPVGFSGMTLAFHPQEVTRVEESQGIVGPLGHVEQLPPYTRYPTHQAPSTENDRTSTDWASSVPNGPASPGSLEDGERLDESPAPALPSTRSNLSESSQTPLQRSGSSETPALNGEKPSSKIKRRFYKGKVPVWVLILVIVVFTVFCAIAVSVSMVMRAHKRSHHNPWPTTTSPTYVMAPPPSQEVFSREFVLG